MRQVISANYLDRDSEFPWLVRDYYASPESAVAVRNVLARNVRFEESDNGSFERQYGCSYIAVADAESVQTSNEPFDMPAAAVPMKFNPFRGFIACEVPQEGVQTMHLGADRKMHAVLHS